MSSKLMVRLQALAPLDEAPGEDRVSWFWMEPDGAMHSGEGLLSEIPGSFEDCWIVVLVPSSEVLSFQLALPRVGMARLRKMVPFAIEEYLSIDLSELHVAVDGFNADGKLLVASVAHEHMKRWLHDLKGVGIVPDVMIPDFWYFPCAPSVWRVWIESDFMWVKVDQDQGFPADIQNLETLIDLKRKEFEQENKPLPQKIELIFKDHSLREELSEKIKNSLNYQVDVFESSRSLLQIIFDNLQGKQRFNLLKPPYGVKRKWGKLKKQWFPVALLLVLWFSFFLLKEAFEYFYLKRQNTSLSKETRSVYQQIFPGANHLNVLKPRLEGVLAKTFKVARGDPFLKRLNQIAGLIKASSVALTGFSYQDQAFILKVEAKDFQAFNALIQAFKQQGISVVQMHTSQEVQGVVSEWVIKK